MLFSDENCSKADYAALVGVSKDVITLRLII